MSYFSFALALAQRDEGTRYVDKALTCCERHQSQLPNGCNQGRQCPLRNSQSTGETHETEMGKQSEHRHSQNVGAALAQESAGRSLAANCQAD